MVKKFKIDGFDIFRDPVFVAHFTLFAELLATLVSLISFAELLATLVSLISFAELLATLVSLISFAELLATLVSPISFAELLAKVRQVYSVATKILGMICFNTALNPRDVNTVLPRFSARFTLMRDLVRFSRTVSRDACAI